MSIQKTQADSDPPHRDAGGRSTLGRAPSGALSARRDAGIPRNLPGHVRALEERIYAEPFAFDFFQAVRLLQQMSGDKLVGYAGHPGAEAVRFRAHLSLSFPASSIHDLLPPGPEQPVPQLVQSFMGLTGPSGVLPRHYTDLLHRLERDRSEKNPEKHALRDWLDLFNHRFVSLFYRAWEKYRFFVAYERGSPVLPEPDVFTSSLYSLVGFGTPSLRNRLRVSVGKSGRDGEGREHVLARVENLTLLRYSGLLAHQVRSAAALQVLLNDYYPFAVQVCQYQGQWLQIEPRNRSRLEDNGNNQLALTAVIGERVWDIQSKFRLRLGPLNYARFLELLPDRSPLPERKVLFLLIQLVRLFVGMSLDFDIQLVLERTEVPECQLDQNTAFGARLGWNTWSRSQAFDRDPDDAVFEGKEVIWITENQ
jgi:type VI secretion system protein ImpH